MAATALGLSTLFHLGHARNHPGLHRNRINPARRRLWEKAERRLAVGLTLDTVTHIQRPKATKFHPPPKEE
jgi:hypothetical protein